MIKELQNSYTFKSISKSFNPPVKSVKWAYLPSKIAIEHRILS